MKLRNYQVEQIKRVIRELKNRGIALLASAVGSGKTLVTKVIISEITKLKELNITRIIIASPLKNIAKEFEANTTDEIYTGPDNINISSYIIKGNSIKFINNDSVKELKRVLKNSNSPINSFSHASLARMKKEIEKCDNLNDTLFVIDEAHHCYEDEDYGTKLGDVVNAAVSKGAKVLYLTATPYRTINSKIVPIIDITKCNPIVRTIGEQINDKYSPNIDIEYVHIKDNLLKNNAIIDDKNTKFNKLSDSDIYCQYIYDKWVADGCPKSIIVIPAGDSVKTASKVKNFFIKKGLPDNISKIRGRKIPIILDAVGNSGTDRERIIDEIKADKQQNGKKYDLVIGCRRFDEGTDVPTVSHVYMIGVPNSVRLFHQRVGRILRDKTHIQDYGNWFGEQWLTKAKATFFVPLNTQIKNLDNQVARQLLHCIFTGENYQAYCNSISTSIEIKKVITNNLNNKLSEDETTNILNTIDSFTMNESFDYHERVEEITVELKKNPDITVKEFCDKLLKDVTEPTNKLQIQNAIINNLSCITDSDIKQLSNNVVTKTISKSKNINTLDLRPFDSIFNTEMESAFKELIDKFGNEKVKLNSENYVDRVCITLDDKDLKKWTEECEFLWNDEERSNKMCHKVCQWIKEHNDRYPSSSSKNKEEKQLGKWLSRKRQSKKDKHNSGSLFYKSDQIIAESYKYHDLFECYSDEKQSNIMLEKICIWINNNDTISPKHNSIGIEKQYWNWISSRKNKKLAIYDSDKKILKKYGYIDLFEKEDLENISNYECIILCKWINKNNGIPSSNSKNVEEKKLYYWLNRKRRAKINKGSCIFYKSDLELAKKYGLPNLFNQQTLEEKSIEECHKICKEIKQNGYPKKKSKAWRWISFKKQAKFNNKSNNKWYPILQTIAESYGLSDLFEMKRNKK
jgi:superfamily II DNA or RNA helicase